MNLRYEMSNLVVFEIFAGKILTLLLHWALILRLLVFCILRRERKFLLVFGAL